MVRRDRYHILRLIIERIFRASMSKVVIANRIANLSAWSVVCEEVLHVSKGDMYK